MHGPGFESKLPKKTFSEMSTPALRPTQPPIQRVMGIIPRGKMDGA